VDLVEVTALFIAALFFLTLAQLLGTNVRGIFASAGLAVVVASALLLVLTELAA
jgi:hypothetical protein